MRNSYGAQIVVRVEDHERPTFEIGWKDRATALRLGVEAAVSGEARCYFGTPVTAGTAKWYVERSPHWRTWEPWFGVAQAAGPQ